MHIQPMPVHFFETIPYNKTIGKKEVEDILQGLVDVLEMSPLSKPLAFEGTASPGWTGVIVIETSHIAIHCFDDLHELWLDILSCKPFDKQKIRTFLKKYI